MLQIARKYSWLIMLLFVGCATAWTFMGHKAEIGVQPPAQLDAATSVERANEGLAAAAHNQK
ncbi:MAG: hypothetical protein JSS24_09825 [Proteobacteria bacterium]|nr:hypothetical protein [Pseudomonadota bacterium]